MRRIPLAAAAVMLAAVPGAVLAAAPQQNASQAAPEQNAGQASPAQNEPTEMIKGKWQATVAGQTYILDLRVDEGDLLGTVTLPSRKVVEVEDGICVSEEFSFSTVEGDVEWEWNGTITETGLEGERERFDTDATEAFTAKRM